MGTKNTTGTIVGDHESIGITEPIKGFSDANMRKVWAYAMSNGITKIDARNHSAASVLLAHAMPSTHAQAVETAKRMLVLHGKGNHVYSTGSIWHGTPYTKPRIYKAGSNLAKYGANAIITKGQFVLACVTHGTSRATCVQACLQGFRDKASTTAKPIWLYDIATTGNGASKPKVSKPKVSKPKARLQLPSVAVDKPIE